MKIPYISQNIEQFNLIIQIRLWHEVLNVDESVQLYMFKVTVMIALEVTKQYDGHIYFITMYMYIAS